MQIINVITYHSHHRMIIHINLNCAIESCVKSSRWSIALWVISQDATLSQEIHTPISPQESLKEIQAKNEPYQSSPCSWA